MFPKDFERNLKEEIWGCFKHIGFPLDTIMKMPVMDRKFYIMMHNKEENERNGDKTTDINEPMSESEREKIEMINMARQIN